MENEQDIINKKILRKTLSLLDVKIIDPKNQRIFPSIYILQAAGIKLGYGFSLGENRPCSQELIYDIYDLKENNHQPMIKFNSSLVSKIGEINKSFILPFDIKKLELLASTHYMAFHWYRDNLGQFHDFKEKIIKQRPKYDSLEEDLLKEAWVNTANLIAYREFDEKFK